MAWLVRDGQVLASLEVASTRRARRVGLLGRSGIEGALLLEPAKSVHTVRMQFPIDVAHLDEELQVLAVTTMKVNRVGRWCRRAHCVVEAEAGAMRSWELKVGDQLEVRE